jgi:hypothetical protein
LNPFDADHTRRLGAGQLDDGIDQYHRMGWAVGFSLAPLIDESTGDGFTKNARKIGMIDPAENFSDGSICRVHL